VGRKEAGHSHLSLTSFLCCPGTAPPLAGPLIEKVDKLWAVLPVHLGPIIEPDINLNIRLVPAGTDEEIAVGSKILDAKDMENQTSLLFLEMSIPPLKEGVYEIRIEAEEAKTKAHGVARKSIIKK
jgi:hypothetical protein